MSNLGIAGFERYHEDGKFKTPTRADLKAYFIEVFYHDPTKEQLDLFFDYLIGREQDAQKVIDICVVHENDLEKQKQ